MNHTFLYFFVLLASAFAHQELSSARRRSKRRPGSFPVYHVPVPKKTTTTTVTTAAVVAGDQLGDYCTGYHHKPCGRGMICQDPNKPGLDVNSCKLGLCKCVLRPAELPPSVCEWDLCKDEANPSGAGCVVVTDHGRFCDFNGKNSNEASCAAYGMVGGSASTRWCAAPAKPICCKALTASCLACAEGVSTDQYCSKHPETVGCECNLLKCVDGYKVVGADSRGCGGTCVKQCCTEPTAECLACAADVPVQEFCKIHTGMYGCDAVAKQETVTDGKFVMETTSNMLQLGKMPYLYGGGDRNMQPNEEACKAQCLADSRCNYGTFVTADTSLSYNSHAFKPDAREGECWLATHTHDRPTACGIPCASFKRTRRADVVNKPVIHKDADRCQLTSYSPVQEYHPCDPANPDPLTFMECMRSCAHRGHFNFKRSTCKCDPSKEQSEFTTCRKDPFGEHINVKHFEPRFHQKEYRGGEQHRCQMIKDDPTCDDSDLKLHPPNLGDIENWTVKHPYCKRSCKCCDCYDHGSFYAIIDIGFGVHTAKEPFLTVDPPIVSNAHKCMQLCHENPLCRAGTFMSDSDHIGQCWLSHFIEPAKKCEDTCESFVKVNMESEHTCDMSETKVLRRDASGMTCRERPIAPPCDCPDEKDPVTCADKRSYSSLCQAHCAKATDCQMVNKDDRICNKIRCKTDENVVGTDKNGCGGYCEKKPDYDTCCQAMTIGCLACQAGMSESQEYCLKKPLAPVCLHWKDKTPLSLPDYNSFDKT